MIPPIFIIFSRQSHGEESTIEAPRKWMEDGLSYFLMGTVFLPTGAKVVEIAVLCVYNTVNVLHAIELYIFKNDSDQTVSG